MSDEQTVLIDSAPERLPVKHKKLNKDILKCVIVLTAIAVVSGLLLGVINWLTYVDPDAAIKSKLSTYYLITAEEVSAADARVINNKSSKDSIAACYEIKDASGALTAIVYRAVGSGGYKGNVELLVHVGTDGIIKAISVYSHSETAGIGSKVLEQKHLEQYIGVDLLSVQSFALGGSGGGGVDSVSGATKTSKAVNNAINAVVYAYQNYQGGGN